MEFNSNYVFDRGVIAMNTREILVSNGYEEVMTPILRSSDAAVNHRYRVENNLFLRDCYELPIRRLLNEDHPKIFELGPCFRPNDRDDGLHFHEFYMVAVYQIGRSIEPMIQITEKIVKSVLPWNIETRIISLRDKMKTDLGIDIKIATPEELADRLVSVCGYDRTRPLFVNSNQYVEEWVEPMTKGIGRLTFIKDYPSCMYAIAENVTGTEYVNRFESFIDCVELGNACVGLMNADEMEKRHKESGIMDQETSEQISLIRNGKIVPNVGYGIGLDRLCMVKYRKTLYDKV